MTACEEIAEKILNVREGYEPAEIEEKEFATAEELMDYLVSIHYDENATCELKA